MKSTIKTKKTLLSFITFHFCILIVFAGCGYKPSSYYAKNKIVGSVYVELVVNIENPKNAVLVKDALNEIVVGNFNSKLVNKKSLADTILTVSLGSVSITALQKDEDGYVDLYRTNVGVTVKYAGPNGSGSVGVSGRYDFSISEGSSISDVKRFEAIKTATSKALEEIVSILAVESFKKEETKEDENKSN